MSKTKVENYDRFIEAIDLIRKQQRGTVQYEGHVRQELTNTIAEVFGKKEKRDMPYGLDSKLSGECMAFNGMRIVIIHGSFLGKFTEVEISAN